MIAKPSLKTIPVAIFLILIVASLGWMFGDGHREPNPSRETTKEEPSATATTSPRKPAPRGKRNNLRPANIDVKKRLQALYQKYPELSIPVKDPEKDLTELYAKLFSEETRDQLIKEITPFKKMIEGDTPWDPEAARDFLAKHQALLNTLIENSGPEYHFQDTEGTENFPGGGHPAIELLSTCFALQAKLEDTTQAIDTYQATQQILQSTEHNNLMFSTISIITRLQLGTFTASLESMPSKIAEVAIQSQFDTQLDLEQTLVGEFSASMKLVYEHARIDEHGNFTFDSDLLPLSAAVPSLNKIENTIATYFIDRIQLLKSSTSILPGVENFDNFIKTLNSPPQKLQDPESQEILELMHVSFGTYYDDFKKTNFILKTQQAALQIGLMNSRDESHRMAWPRHYKTGERIVMDKKNNQLITGLKGEASTIKIPTIAPPVE